MKNRILVLGNEFIELDSLSKRVCENLKDNFKVININDSFQLMSELNTSNKIIILDVVQDMKEVCFLSIDDLRFDSIITAHDFDAGFVLKLFQDKISSIKIIGIPQKGDIKDITEQVISLLSS